MKLFFGDRLRRVRGKLSQAEMCGKLGIKQSTYSSWECNINEPNIEMLVKICTTFSVSADWLIGVSTSQTGNAEFGDQRGVAERQDVEYGRAPCGGCAARDARIDKLLDILSHRSACSTHHLSKEDGQSGRVLPAGLQASGR